MKVVVHHLLVVLLPPSAQRDKRRRLRMPTDNPEKDQLYSKDVRMRKVYAILCEVLDKAQYLSDYFDDQMMNLIFGL